MAADQSTTRQARLDELAELGYTPQTPCLYCDEQSTMVGKLSQGLESPPVYLPLCEEHGASIDLAFEFQINWPTS